MAEQRLPEQVTMGLLPYLNAHALDEDYVQAAERRAQVGSAKERPRVGRMGAIALSVFAVLAITAALQTSQDSTSEEKERRALIAQVKDNRAELAADRKTEAALSRETRRLEDDLLRASDDTSGLLRQLDLLRVRTGIAPVRGPGVEVVVDDKPGATDEREKVLDVDLQKLVNGLWQAGAEAISINGERLTVLSAIRHASNAITVNFRSLRPPYRVLAIGDRRTMPARFGESSSGQAWLTLKREVGLQFTMTSQASLRLPGADVPTLRFTNKQEPKAPGREQS